MRQAIHDLRAARVFLVAALLALWFAVPAFAQQRVMQETLVDVTSSSLPGNSVERIDFTGKAAVRSRLARDPATGRDELVLFIDLNGVAASSSKSKKRVNLTAQESLQLPHAGSQSIEFPFTIQLDQNGRLSDARLGVARVSLNVDIATGNVTSAVADLAAQ